MLKTAAKNLKKFILKECKMKKKLDDFIEIYDDSMPESLIDRFVEFFDNNPSLQNQGRVQNPTGEGAIVPDVKLSTDISAYELPGSMRDEYVYHIQQCLNKYVEKYTESNTVARFGITENFNMQKYEPHEGFKAWHKEHEGNGSPNHGVRHLVFMTYLNTVKDQGGTEFLYQKRTLDAVKGRTVIWPAGWTHTHRGVVSKTETKYIMTGWWNFLPQPPEQGEVT